MDFGEYLMTLVKSYNPNQYHNLVDKEGKEIFQFMLYTLGLSLVVFVLLIVPIAGFYVMTINERLEPIQKMNVAAEIQTTGPVTLLNHPHIVMDLDANATQPRTITLTKDGLHYPTLYLFGDSTIPWSKILDLKNNAQTDAFLLAAFLLPSIIFWVLAWFAIKTILIFFILITLAILIPKIFGYTLEKGEAIKIAIFSSPSLFLFDFALEPIAPLFWWGLLLSAIYFWIAVLLAIEPMKKEHIKQDRQETKKHK